MQVLFLDESGDHGLSIIDPQYPVFVLGGVIMDKEYAESFATEKINQFKLDLFGNSDIILHTADIVRSRNKFDSMRKPEFRNRFYCKLNELMRSLEYSVVACAIRKDNHLRRYGLAAVDPYMLSLDVLVERFCFELERHKTSGIIVAERRDATLDNQLELAWLNLKIQGTQFIRASRVDARIEGLTLRSKRDNIAGLQLADLVVSPIGRHVIGKTGNEDWAIVQEKFRRSPRGRIEGYGLVCLPKE